MLYLATMLDTKLLDIHIYRQFTLITFKLQNHLKTLYLIFTYLNQPLIEPESTSKSCDYDLVILGIMIPIMT